MNFYEYISADRMLSHPDGVEALYKELMALDSKLNNSRQFSCEWTWIKTKRPYYRLWPGVIKPLINLRLDKVPGDSVRVPRASLLLTNSVDCPHTEFTVNGKIYNLRTIMVSQAYVLDAKADGVILHIDFGERHPTGTPVYNTLKLPLNLSENLESQYDRLESEDSSSFGLQIPKDVVKNALRLAVACCLLAEDDEMITADVLSKDRGKPITDVEINRAHRRGKVGWDVGKKISVDPTWRMTHFMTLKAGVANRDVTRIVSRKGHFIHRKAATQVPTGEFG